MVRFPNAKINIGLQITGKRSDGYHDLQTIFYPVDLKEALEIIPGDKNQTKEISFSQTGLSITGNATENICIKAYHILKKDFPQLPFIQMHLHKLIAMGAGLGGGSSDGAHTLKMLNEIFQLGISESALCNYALQLGSDCPFFIKNKPVYAQGRGEVFEDIDPILSDYQIRVVCPDIHIATATAFSGLVMDNSHHTDLKQAIKLPPEEWKALIKNDFEDGIFKKYPEIKEIKADLYRRGAVYASMSGSGSAVFGVFPK